VAHESEDQAAIMKVKNTGGPDLPDRRSFTGEVSRAVMAPVGGRMMAGGRRAPNTGTLALEKAAPNSIGPKGVNRE